MLALCVFFFAFVLRLFGSTPSAQCSNNSCAMLPIVTGLTLGWTHNTHTVIPVCYCDGKRSIAHLPYCCCATLVVGARNWSYPIPHSVFGINSGADSDTGIESKPVNDPNSGADFGADLDSGIVSRIEFGFGISRGSGIGMDPQLQNRIQN